MRGKKAQLHQITENPEKKRNPSDSGVKLVALGKNPVMSTLCLRSE